MFDGAGVQLMGGQEAIHRGQAEGAGLEGAFLDKLAHDPLDGELGYFWRHSNRAWQASGLSALREPLSLRGWRWSALNNSLVAPKAKVLSFHTGSWYLILSAASQEFF